MIIENHYLLDSDFFDLLGTRKILESCLLRHDSIDNKKLTTNQ
jgi:hypothetical protein